MSLFRRPTEDSSESDSESDGDTSQQIAAQDDSRAESEGLFGAELTGTETLSSGESISVGDASEEGGIVNVEHHRNMMFASLLEDFYRARAAELFNAASPGANYHRSSPEIQSLANTLFTQASQDLAGAGILPSSTSTAALRSSRQQYLTGFDNLGLQNLKENDMLPTTLKPRLSIGDASLALIKPGSTQPVPPSHLLESHVRHIATRPGSFTLLSHPSNDMAISTYTKQSSHYQSSFHETRLLGKGGFGRVYHTYNFFDKKEYAVKKIPLSPRLSQKYREKGHAELANILREVQALAQLDHCNVVRYHATWIEDPITASLPVSTLRSGRPHRKQMLLDDKPAFPPRRQSHKVSELDDLDLDRKIDGLSLAGDGIVFEGDSVHDRDMDPGWSFQSQSRRAEPSSVLGSDIFSDGVARCNSQEKLLDDPDCYVLHVQMSMYPMTLTQYLSPSPRDPSGNPDVVTRRHCYHLVPSLKILLGILHGLQYIHSKGFVHRDIKPSNVFLSTHGCSNQQRMPDGWHDVGSCVLCKRSDTYYVNPRIGDFGLVADLADDVRGSSGSMTPPFASPVGTQYYRPPVDSKGKSAEPSRRVDEKLDVYALGVILVEMLCCCGTSMERLDLLRGLQSQKIPETIQCAIDAENHASGTGTLVQELVLGMVDRDAKSRFDCARVKENIESILRKCRCVDYDTTNISKSQILHNYRPMDL